MPKNRQYIKAPLDYRDLLILLSEKGLKINDQLKAEALLCNIGFYRLIGYGLAPPTLDSWLHSLTFIRNASAHHSRLFAKKLPLPPKIDKGLPLSKDNYVFNHICVIDYFLSKIEPSNNWLAQVQNLLQEVAANQKHFGITGK